MSLGSCRVLLPLALVASMPISAPAQSRPFTAEDMLDIVSFAAEPIALSSRGDAVAYVLADPAYEWNVLERRPVGHAYLQLLGPGGPAPPKALTTGARWSSWPAWSPDGGRLAFFVDDGDEYRLAIWSREDGRAREVGLSFDGRPYLAPQWSPDGRFIVYAASVRPPEPGPVARVRVLHSSDERLPGDDVFVDKRMARLVRVDVATGRTTPLVTDPLPLRGFRLSPDGRNVLYRAPSPETFGLIRREQIDSFVVAADGSAPARRLGQPDERLGWSPDGRSLVAVRERKLWQVPLDGSSPRVLLPEVDLDMGEPVFSPDGRFFLTLVVDPSLTDPEIEPPRPGMYTIARPFFDLYVVSLADGNVRNVTEDMADQIADPVWSPDGRSVYFRAIDNETYDETLYRYALATDERRALIAGKESFGNLVAAPQGLLVAAEAATHPPDLWLVEAETARRTRLTRLNPQLDRFRFAEPELFHFYDMDGERLGALLYRPPGLPPDAKFPVITYVYEKLTPGIHRFSPRHQIFLTHGYGVLMPNVKVRVGRTGTSFVKSVVPAVNAVRAMGVDNGRFALWGGSFGAYATSYVITQTNLFACAVSRATPPELFRNWASGRDRDSENIERGQARMGGSPFEVMERYLTQSAFFQLDKVETPVLIMHGVQDRTILFDEGAMMFYALRRLGKDATFVAYAHGDHSLSRHSRADTIDVHRRMLAWFERYLRPESDSIAAARSRRHRRP